MKRKLCFFSLLLFCQFLVLSGINVVTLIFFCHFSTIKTRNEAGFPAEKSIKVVKFLLVDPFHLLSVDNFHHFQLCFVNIKPPKRNIYRCGTGFLFNFQKGVAPCFVVAIEPRLL